VTHGIATSFAAQAISTLEIAWSFVAHATSTLERFSLASIRKA
jgi:hypothetical protein